MSNQRAEMRVGGISATMTEHGVHGDFHATALKEVRHFAKSEPNPETGSHGNHEFNILEFESGAVIANGKTTFSLFMGTDTLRDLIQQAQAALNAAEWEAARALDAPQVRPSDDTGYRNQ